MAKLLKLSVRLARVRAACDVSVLCPSIFRPALTMGPASAWLVKARLALRALPLETFTFASRSFLTNSSNAKALTFIVACQSQW
jgi:hypothetical protein